MKEYLLKIKSDKRILIIIIALVGLLLIINPFKSDSTKTVLADISNIDYAHELEDRIKNIVSSIDGAGDCTVMVNLISTSESVYVTENKKSYDSSDSASKSESEDSIIKMSDSDGNEYALIKKKIMPEISGVTVICEGGNNNTVKSSVIVAVSTVLNIGTNKVCVIAKAN